MIDYSPEAIAERLQQVSEARDLGFSLRKAGASRIRDGAAPRNEPESPESRRHPAMDELLADREER